MCDPLTLTAAAGAGAAATGGATAATAGLTLGQLALTAGTLVSSVGTLAAGAAQSAASRDMARQEEAAAATERALGAVEDQRTRDRMRVFMARRSAQLAGRGVQLDSPTAVALADDAARELSFASQSTRSRTAARFDTLTASARQNRALAGRQLFGGAVGAAGGLLTRAPELWPDLADVRVLG